MPSPYAIESPQFNVTGSNVSSFLREYMRLCKRYQTQEFQSCDLLEDYYSEDLRAEIRKLVARADGSLATLQKLLRDKYASLDHERLLTTESALDQFVQQAKRQSYEHDLLAYSRHFTTLLSRIEEAGNVVGPGRKVLLYLQGLPENALSRTINKLQIDALNPQNTDFDNVVRFVDSIARSETSRKIIE